MASLSEDIPAPAAETSPIQNTKSRKIERIKNEDNTVTNGVGSTANIDFYRIKQYIWRSKKRVGILVAEKNAGEKEVRIGWSMCHISKEPFDPQYGLDLALKRSYSKEQGKVNNPIPSSMANSYNKFEKRCKEYFKDATKIQTWPIRPNNSQQQ